MCHSALLILHIAYPSENPLHPPKLISMDSQQQDLVFFTDNTLISDSLFKENSLCVISHSEGTSSTWLLNTLVEACIIGSANQVNRELPTQDFSLKNVYYVSFLHSRDFVVKSARKHGLDLASCPNFNFIDCTNVFIKFAGTSSSESIKESLKKIFLEIYAEIALSSNSIVLIDSPELLLTTGQFSSSDFFEAASPTFSFVPVFFNIDISKAVVDLLADNKSDPVFEISDFYVKLLHRSSLNINLLPLSTGKAKNITGCLTVAKGSVNFQVEVAVLEKQYVYHVSKDHTVKIHFR